MKKLLTLLMLCFSCICVFAAGYHTVPIGDTAYRIVDVALMRGIIPLQSDVRPYTIETMRDLLLTIRDSGGVSASETNLIDSIVAEYDRQYGSEQSIKFSDVLGNGFVRFGSPENNMTIGGSLSSKNVAGYNFSNGKVIDTRNRVLLYARGNLFDFLSYDFNVGLHVEKINMDAYLPMDFPIDMSANYFEFPRNDVAALSNSRGLLWGFSSNPEIGMSFLDGRINIRFASVKRNWGPSDNNLGLSASASTMAGLELNIKPFNWLEYSVMHSSLTKFALDTFGGENWKTGDGVKWPSDCYDNDKFDNMFSIHRIDFKLGGFNLGLYENVVWRKRFELAYLNPVAVYQVIQNEVSDFDNMMFGFDFSYNIKDFGKVYFALALDELSSLSLSTFFINARHIMAVQGGMDIQTSIGNFSTMGFQVTYIPPFFGTHYLQQNNPWGSVDYYTMYVNKGRPISYPLNPDSLEIRIKYNMDFGSGYSFALVVKDQMRSAQYAVTETGTDIFTSMLYSESDNYAVKKFFSNIWNNILDLEVDVSKKFDGFPLTVNAGLQFVLESSRSFDLSSAVEVITGSESAEHLYGKYNPGYNVTYGSWQVPQISVLGKIAVSIGF